MKNKLFFLIAVLCLFGTYTQAASYKYYFFYNLKEKSAAGPDLVAQCTANYAWEVLPMGFGKSVHKFDKACGLIFNDSLGGFLSSGTYTVEMYFRLDTTTGYKKLIDYNNLTADAGFYSYNGKLNLYPSFTSADSFIGPNTFQYVALTRDNVTKKMYVYHNNKVAGSHNDSTDKYVYGANKRLIFFRDDTGTGGEHTGGGVALIIISNTVMDSTMIKNNYNGLGGTLTGIENTAVADDIRVYPNPVTDYLHITTAQPYNYTMSSITGITVFENTLQKGENKINLEKLPAGLYLLNIAGAEDTGGRVYKILKQ